MCACSVTFAPLTSDLIMIPQQNGFVNTFFDFFAIYPFYTICQFLTAVFLKELSIDIFRRR